MKRLLKISFDSALLSLTPILSWFLLSLLVDKNLINVFTLTYPLQCIYGIIVSPFAVGANISKAKDKNPDAVMSGLLVGIILTLLCYGLALTNIDSYIIFMNMDPNTYRTFAVYSIINLITQTILAFILNKLYYEDRNALANRYSFTFNFLNFVILIGLALLTKNQFVIVGVTSIIMVIYTAGIVIKNCNKFHFHLNFLHCFKYDSANFISSTTSFFVYLFGLSNVLEFGAEYGLAATFVSLITDTQWDVLESINSLAKIDISKHRFDFKQSLRNSYKLLTLLFASTAIMFFTLYRFYDLNLGLTLTFLGLEIFDFILSPFYYLYTCYLQLNWSSSKTAINKFIARFSRLIGSFLPTPFCNNIGAIWASLYQILTTRFFFRKNFITDKNGRISRRRTRRKSSARYAYNDLVVDKS